MPQRTPNILAASLSPENVSSWPPVIRAAPELRILVVRLAQSSVHWVIFCGWKIPLVVLRDARVLALIAILEITAPIKDSTSHNRAKTPNKAEWKLHQAPTFMGQIT